MNSVPERKKIGIVDNIFSCNANAKDLLTRNGAHVSEPLGLTSTAIITTTTTPKIYYY
jgi:hypothetical protein